MIRIEWQTEIGHLVALEPTPAEIAQHAAALSAGYNEPTNAELMGHANLIAPHEVIESYTDSIAAGMRAFLLFCSGELAGDGDLRNLRGRSAEFAFMIAARTAQGKGLGTRFATMIHLFGFRTLELERIYASVVPQNVASRRVFEKLGYVIDDGDAAREYAEEPGDITLMITRQAFLQRYMSVVDNIQIGER